MADTNKKPLTFKGILALLGAGLLYLVAKLTGVDLSALQGPKDGTTAGQEAPASPGAGADPGKKAPMKKTAPKETAPKTPELKKPEPKKPEPKKVEPKDAAPKADDTKKVAGLFRAMRSDVQVEVEGEVVHILPDDNQGSRHQLFLLELSNGITLKVSHNIDIAPYINGIAKGDTARVYGEYEWNDKGGVVHWTHRNTRGGSHPGGWILHKGQKYE